MTIVEAVSEKAWEWFSRYERARQIDDIISFGQHMHRAGEKGRIDTCTKCGLDIRHLIHRRGLDA